MAKITNIKSRESGENPQEIEIKETIHGFEEEFIREINATIENLSAIKKETGVSRIGRLPKEDTEWKKWTDYFIRLRASWLSKMAIVQSHAGKEPNLPFLDKLNQYVSKLESFDSSRIKDPTAEDVIKGLKKFVEECRIIKKGEISSS